MTFHLKTWTVQQVEFPQISLFENDPKRIQIQNFLRSSQHPICSKMLLFLCGFLLFHAIFQFRDHIAKTKSIFKQILLQQPSLKLTAKTPEN